MKTLLIILILISELNAFKSEKEVQIGVHSFILVKKSYNEYGDKGITMALYTKDTKNSRQKKLSFLLRNESGPCSDKNIENGSYKIKEDSIVFYTHWKRSRSSYNVPIGDRMQVFKVDKNGSFYMIDSKVYVERTKRNKDEDEGMQYLYTEAKTENEKLLLDEYITSVEDTFKAKFVMGDEAKKLEYEVNKALLLKHRQQWE